MAAGHRVTTVTQGDRFARRGDGYALSPEQGRDGYDALIRDLVATGRTPDRIAHFWLVTGAERFRPGSSFFHRNLEAGFWSVTFLAQAMTAESLPPVHLTIVTTGAESLRGEPLPYPEKATIAGPARVLPREMPGTTCATLDVTLPAAGVVAQVMDDLLADPANGRAALRGPRRFAATLKPVALPDAQGLTLPPGATVLMTGGLGGIALTLAEDLARRFAARFLIVTRSPLPPRADWPRIAARGGDMAPRLRALMGLELLGSEVVIRTADVCNLEDMRAAVAEGTERLGPIRAVIHAAGVVDDAPLADRSTARIEQVLAPKLHGTQVLDRLFPDGTVDWIALFASTSTQIGAAGQVDYVAANEYMNAWSQSRAGGRTKVVAVNWGVWQGAGMAARAIARRSPAPPRPLPGPVLTARGTDAAGDALFTGRLTPADWVIDGHRTRDGRAILPGTGIVALIAQALAAEGIDRFTLRDLTFLRALDVPAPRDLRLTLRPSNEGFAFDLQASLRIDGRTGWLTHAQGRVAVTALVPATLDTAAIAARCAPPETGTGLPSPQESHLTFGPRWRVLHSRALGQAEGLARLSLPPAHAAESADWRLHPALLDIATGWAMALIPGYAGADLWVPVTWTAAQVHAPLPAEVLSHVRLCPGATADSAAFDVTLSDPQGHVCATVSGLTLRRLPGGLTLPPPDPRQIAFDDAARPLSAAEERLARAVAQGIRPEEGPEAFARAMSAGLPQILISPGDLPALVAEAAAPPPRAPQPAASTDDSRIAPRNDIERTLAGFWQDLLGVSPVGVTDDFFALGGHSLIAVRLFAMVRRAFRVDFPISILFEAPTIAACAALIEARIGTPDTAPKAPERRFTHLVAMHDGAGGPGQPFFLVAGMFGNVLNLRHLAHLIGGDRPFWGLQARGLYGDAPPHATLTEAAADYIAELRQVQPRGPYLLGGFSGGGLTAWEMAHQLEQAGEEVSLLALLDTPLPMRPALTRADRAAIKWQLIRANRAPPIWRNGRATGWHGNAAAAPRPPRMAKASTTPRSRPPSAPPCRAGPCRAATGRPCCSARRWTAALPSPAGAGSVPRANMSCPTTP
jgi:NAD(P)-dependent dehydrogenase (short-subunit alcohol dehydrogenase family)